MATIYATTYNAYSTNTSNANMFSYTTDRIFFDFTPLNVSQRYTAAPTFEQAPSLLAGFNASAIATLSVPASSLDNLFFFQGFDLSSSLINTSALYGINTSFRFNNISFSNASLTAGAINATYNASQLVKSDYVNYLAFAITGGYNLADIFSNEIALATAVSALDPNFVTSLNTSITSVAAANTGKVINLDLGETNASVYLDTYQNASNNPYVTATQTLVDGLLNTVLVAGNTRGKVFLDDLKTQTGEDANIESFSTLTSYYYVPFHAGDTLALLVNYVPTNGNGAALTNLGSNPVYTRSYKILLNCY